MDENPFVTPDSPERKQASGSKFLAWFPAIGIVFVVVALFLPSVRFVPRGKAAAVRVQNANDLKNIALALYSYRMDNGSPPPAFTTDANGTPLHSWRTLILPYLDRQDLHAAIDFSKPWDDAVNKAAFETEIPVFHGRNVSEPWHTNYHAVLDSSQRFDPMNDDEEPKLLLVEVPENQAVHWMAPVDKGREFLAAVENGKVPGEREFPHNGGTNVAYANGVVRFHTNPRLDSRLEQ